MFLLNNLNDRDHKKLYPHSKGEHPAIFDISQQQIESKTNSDWHDVAQGSLVCVVCSSRKMSTIFRVESIECSGVNEGRGEIQIIRGIIAAKFKEELSYTQTLNKYSVAHPKLPKNIFTIGFNVANLGEQLDKVVVKVRGGYSKIGELKKA